MQYSSESNTKKIASAYRAVTENDWKDTMPDQNPDGFSFGVMPYFIKPENGNFTPYHLTSSKIVENEEEFVASRLEDTVRNITNAISKRIKAVPGNIWADKTDNGSIVLDDKDVRIADMFKYCIVVTLDANPDGKTDDNNWYYIVFGINSQDDDKKIMNILQTVADRCDGLEGFVDGYADSKKENAHESTDNFGIYEFDKDGNAIANSGDSYDNIDVAKNRMSELSRNDSSKIYHIVKNADSDNAEIIKESDVNEGNSSNLVEKSKILQEYAAKLADNINKIYEIANNGIYKIANSIPLLDYLSVAGDNIKKISDSMVAEISKYR